MNLKKQIEEDLKKAMLAREKDELRALRAIKSVILLAETEKGAKDVLSEESEIKLLTKAAKQRRDSATLYREQNREDLALAELSELEVINRYLPQQISKEELVSILKEIITKTGASGLQDMGKVMGMAIKELAGKADGKFISETVKTLLN
jgi:uncharacterized protein